VLLFNLVASKTREGKVLKRLLEKLETIRKALTSDKGFDVIGAQFEGMSLRDLMIRAVVEDNADELAEQIERGLTKEKARETLRAVERRYPRTGDVAGRLVEQRLQLEKEDLRRLLPGYVRRFLEKACPLMGLRLDGDLDGMFQITAAQRGAADWLLPLLETYPEEARGQFTVLKPEEGEAAVFLHPGERVFDRLCALIETRYQQAALAGSVFCDPWADAPYFVHVARVQVVRAMFGANRESGPAGTAGLPAGGGEANLEWRMPGDGPGTTAVAARRGVRAGSVRVCPTAGGDGSGTGGEVAEGGAAGTASGGAPKGTEGYTAATTGVPATGVRLSRGGTGHGTFAPGGEGPRG
jgi:hypothetical protein